MSNKQMHFMDLKIPFSTTTTIGNKQKASDLLLEPINHNDEITIQRLISIHHTRSFTTGIDIDNLENELNEQQIYTQKRDEIINSIDAFSDDDFDLDCANDDNDKARRISYTLPSHTQHRISLTNNDNCNTTDMEAMHRVLNDHKSYSNDEDEDDENDRKYKTVPLHKHNKFRNKIKRDKTPNPYKNGNSYGNKLEIKLEDHKTHIFKSISGDLEKKSANKFVGWQKRWFYLWKDKLDYYKESSLQIRGSIHLWDVAYVGIVSEYNMSVHNGVPTVAKNKSYDKHKFMFEIRIKNDKTLHNCGRIYYIRTNAEHTRDHWIGALNNNLKIVSIINNRGLDLKRDRNSSKYKRDRNAPRSKSIPRKQNTGRVRHKSVPFRVKQKDKDKEVISFLDIEKYSNTGDILLFDSKSKSGACVRVATGGGYDHIGMIFRLKDGKVGVLEALGSGVQVFLWQNFRKYNWEQQYSKISFRSLLIPDTYLRKEIQRKLALFVKTVADAKYGWNPIQLIRKQSAVSLYDESRTFFCSELVAKALKESGLLRSDFASSQYFPSHFQESKHITLLKGCSFSKEMCVVWEGQVQSNPQSGKKRKGMKHRAKTTAEAPSIVKTVSLNSSKDKKRTLKSPPPRQLY